MPEPKSEHSKNKLTTLFHQATTLPGIVSIAVVLAMLFVYLTAAPGEVGIANVDYARGMITLLFAVGTVMIALLLTLSAIFLTGDDAKERFDRGKEVLSLLIGIFGTIIGFYFGSATQEKTVRKDPVQQQERSIEKQPQIKDSLPDEKDKTLE